MRRKKANPSSCKLEGFIMEPLVGFEPTTVRLQGGCSTTELKRRNEWMRTMSTEEAPPWQAENGRHRGAFRIFKRVRRQTGNPVPAAVLRMNPGKGERHPAVGAFLPERMRFPQIPARRPSADDSSSVVSLPVLAVGMMRETRSTGCLVMMLPWAPRFLIRKSAKWKGLIRLRSLRTAFR